MPSFDGKFYRLPTVAVKTDVSSFVNFGLAPGGIVAMMGSAQGGTPNEVVRFTDPNEAAQYFRSGDLVTAAQQAWQHGAQVIYLTRIGNALQSTKTVSNVASANIATITADGYGAYTNDVEIKIENGSLSGKKMTVRLYDTLTNRTTLEVKDNAATIQDLADYFNTTLPSTLITITVASSAGIPRNTVGYEKMTGGSDGTLTTQDWVNGLNLYANEFVNILHPAGSTDEVVHALFKTHVETYSQQKRERTAIVGAPAASVIGAVGTADSLVDRAYNLNSERMVLVAPGSDEKSGAYTAAKIVGLVAGVDVATPITYRTISATSLSTKYSESEKDTLVKYGVCVIEEVPQGRRVVRGITTIQDPSEGVEDAFKEYSIERIKDYLTDNVRSILETSYIGKKGIAGVESQMQATVASILSRMKESQIITGYRNIIVTKDPNDAKVYFVTYQVAPVSPINWIFVTQQFVNNIA